MLTHHLLLLAMMWGTGRRFLWKPQKGVFRDDLGVPQTKMRRPSGSSSRDESIAAKWSDLRFDLLLRQRPCFTYTLYANNLTRTCQNCPTLGLIFFSDRDLVSFIHYMQVISQQLVKIVQPQTWSSSQTRDTCQQSLSWTNFHDQAVRGGAGGCPQRIPAGLDRYVRFLYVRIMLEL